MTKKAKDVGASVKAQLLRIARERGDDYQLLLLRYANERLLYRLAVSPYASRFVLKRAALFTLWTGLPHRATRYIDLLGIGDPSEAHVRKVLPTTSTEIAAFRSANVNAGYRLRVANASVTTGTANTLNVDIQWVNDNVAPTYLVWKAILVLRGTSSIELPLAVDLRNAMPDGPLQDIETLHPASLPTGNNDLLLRVDDAQSISPPMNLAMQGRDANGNYLLGTLQIP